MRYIVMPRCCYKIFVLLTGFTLLNGNLHANDLLPEFDCLLEPEMVVNLSSQVDGIVKDILVDKSDLVRKGQVLAVLDFDIKLATVALARVKANMDDEINLKRINFRFAKRQLDRISKLYTTNTASSAQKDEAETELQRTRMELRNSKKRKKLAELELYRAIKAYNQNTIRSPFTGVVVDRFLSPGESVEEKPILKLVQIDPLRVELILPSELFGQIHIGMQANIQTEAPARGVQLASVTSVDRVIDAASGTFSVRLAIPNKDHKIPSGLKCKAQFLAQADKSGSSDGNAKSSSADYVYQTIPGPK